MTRLISGMHPKRGPAATHLRLPSEAFLPDCTHQLHRLAPQVSRKGLKMKSALQLSDIGRAIDGYSVVFLVLGMALAVALFTVGG